MPDACTGSRNWAFQGYRDKDNGPDAATGRGANLPAVVGADPAGAWPACASTEAAMVQGGHENAVETWSGGAEVSVGPGAIVTITNVGLGKIAEDVERA